MEDYCLSFFGGRNPACCAVMFFTCSTKERRLQNKREKAHATRRSCKYARACQHPVRARSTVRGAIVVIMLAGGLQGKHRAVTAKHLAGAPTPSAPDQLRDRSESQQRPVREGHGDFRSVGRELGDEERGDPGSCWRMVVAEKSGAGAAPRDSSTCLLWCAVALGALVRGCPLANVRGVRARSWSQTAYPARTKVFDFAGLFQPRGFCPVLSCPHPTEGRLARLIFQLCSRSGSSVKFRISSLQT